MTHHSTDQTTSKLKSNFIISFSLFIHFKIHLMCVFVWQLKALKRSCWELNQKEGRRSMLRGLCHEALITKESEIRFTHHVLCTSRWLRRWPPPTPTPTPTWIFWVFLLADVARSSLSLKIRIYPSINRFIPFVPSYIHSFICRWYFFLVKPQAGRRKKSS